MRQKSIRRQLTRLEIEQAAKEVGIHSREIWKVKSETVLHMIANRRKICTAEVKSSTEIVFLSA